MSTNFQGKTALITGASSGIGEALSRLLASQGAKLILVARNLEALTQLKEQLDSNVRIYSVDIRSESAVQKFNREIADVQIDILVNNAGIACCDHFDNLTSDDFRGMMETNYLAQVWMTQAILPAMKKRGSGQIINIASMAGAIGMAGYTAYSPSKFALVGFSESLSNELAGTGVKLTLVLPSDVDTPQFHAENQTKPAATKALSGTVHPITAEQAAKKIVQAVSTSSRHLVLSPASGRLLFWLCRLFPTISRKIMDNKTAPLNR